MKVVEIEIGDSKVAQPPVNLLLPKTGAPVSHKFRLVPKFNPKLESYVRSVMWNCVEKTLALVIQETAEFSAFEWFGTINDRWAEMQRSAFSDMEQDSLLLTYLDDGGKEVTSFKFKDVSLTSHATFSASCDQFGVDTDCALTHSITLSYRQFCRVLPPKDLDKQPDPDPLDKEWTSYKP